MFKYSTIYRSDKYVTSRTKQDLLIVYQHVKDIIRNFVHIQEILHLNKEFGQYFS